MQKGWTATKGTCCCACSAIRSSVSMSSMAEAMYWFHFLASGTLRPQSQVLLAPLHQFHNVLPLACVVKNGNPRTVYETNDNQWHPTAIQNLRLLSANSCHISREAENEAFGKLAPPQCRNPRVAHPRCQAAAGPQRRRWWRISHIPKRRSQKMSWRHLHHQ